MKLCSACLLGIRCRYDGSHSFNIRVAELLKKEVLIPVCPEQLGGLPTPREPAEIKNGRVITRKGADVTENFHRGAEQTLMIAKLFGIREAILKQKSPSCGCGKIYDGTFTGKIIKGYGVTATLLIKNRIQVIPDEEI